MFRRSLIASFFRVALKCLTLKMMTLRILRDVRSCSLSDTASYPRRLETSAVLCFDVDNSVRHIVLLVIKKPTTCTYRACKILTYGIPSYTFQQLMAIIRE
jgi:hypothetical protein